MLGTVLAVTKDTIGQMKSSLLIHPSDPLKPQDSPHQTYGCRHQNPDNCSSNSMENICAFVTANNICKKPPTTWARQYENLLMLADITNHIK